MELTVREIQLQTLKIVKVIDKIAKEINIKYVLMYGTLIGAIRHKGFIPWDDDFDIIVLRNDYEKLKDFFITHQGKLGTLEFFSKETRKEYPYMIGRICDTKYKLVSENEKDYGMGVFVDIYPLDGAGDGTHIFLYKKACLCCTLLGMKSRLHFSKTFSLRKNILKYCIYILSKIVSENFLEKKLIEYSKKYKYSESDYLCCMQWMDGGQVVLIDKGIFDNIIDADFEGEKLPVPSNYDELLKKIYGNYMELPPEPQRIGHHYYKIFLK